jgi:HEAT repeat protein
MKSLLLAILLTFSTATLRAVDNPFKTGSNDEIIATIDQMVKNKSRDKSNLAAMTALLNDPDASVGVRERVAWAIGQLDLRSESPKLLVAAKDKGLLVRAAAVNSLIRMRARSAYSVFLDIAKNDPVLSLRQKAVLGIGLLRWEKAAQDLAQLSSDERAEVRASCTLAMAATHSVKSDFSQILKEMKSDMDPFVQERAGTALTLIKGKRDEKMALLESEDSDIRLVTAQHFHYAGNSADLKKIKEAYNSEADENVRLELNDALKAIEKRAKTSKKPAAKSVTQKKG